MSERMHITDECRIVVFDDNTILEIDIVDHHLEFEINDNDTAVKIRDVANIRTIGQFCLRAADILEKGE